jgi:signal peptidase I
VAEWAQNKRLRLARQEAGQRFAPLPGERVDDLLPTLREYYWELRNDPRAWRAVEDLIASRPELFRAFRPELITDFMGYNTFETANDSHPTPPPNWVGDLMLEVEVEVAQPSGELVLELSEGVDRFQARFDLGTGVCSLWRLQGKGEEKLDSKVTAVRQQGTYRLRFANVDDRLTLWVNGALPFGEGVNYEEPVKYGPFEGDLKPASIGARGADLTVRRIKLWRDTYYTQHGGPQADAAEMTPGGWSDPEKWDPLRGLPARTLFVQPGHYLCLGDNSPESSDGRTWGLVPERLMLGRAMLVYYPFYFPFPPLSTPVNRVGVIE